MEKNLKIFNDPIYGFIRTPHPFVLELIDHPYFQRLRRICQTGMTNLVYPGAVHSRFHHALGAMHLMQKAIHVLRVKGIEISEEEELASNIAILLHDIGHGPFSHALEHVIIENVHHEEISIMIMEELNQTYNGKLSLAIQIFRGNHPKKFLTQLISSQLDVDRLDYLKRDSFYSGVVEGNINSDRIISMLNVANNQLVIDEKGIYSVEKFLTSRMLMYWQVYLHKTSIAAEIYLLQTLKRAKELIQSGATLFATESFQYFLEKDPKKAFTKEELIKFTELDDFDVLSSIKAWQKCDDKILSILSKILIQRKLPKVAVRENAVTKTEFKSLIRNAEQILGVENGTYFVHQTPLVVQAYRKKKGPIQLLKKNGEVIPLHESERNILVEPLRNKIKKYHLCYLDEHKNGV